MGNGVLYEFRQWEQEKWKFLVQTANDERLWDCATGKKSIMCLKLKLYVYDDVKGKYKHEVYVKKDLNQSAKVTGITETSDA